MFCTLTNMDLEQIYPIMHLLKYISGAIDKPSKEITLRLFGAYLKHLTLLTIKLFYNLFYFCGIRGTHNYSFNSYLSDRYEYT